MSTALKISKPDPSLTGTIALPGSKSESNRVLIIRALCNQFFTIGRLSSAQDTQTLNKLLADENPTHADVGPAGTTMRFLTAFYAIRPGTDVLLTGSERMKKRPVKILVDALRQLGADITYAEQEGYPPLRIRGKELQGGAVEIEGNVSSQYITALLLIAPVLANGLVLHFTTAFTSAPYIRMTLQVMERFGIHYSWENNKLTVPHQSYHPPGDYLVEPDWSSASYWYSMAAMASEVAITLEGLKQQSIQGDAMVAPLYSFFGVKTEFTDNGVRLTKSRECIRQLGIDFSDCPDLAPTVAVTAMAKHLPFYMTGIHTLVIKESNRIEALQKELQKFGVRIHTDNKSMLAIHPVENKPFDSVTIETYDDHRMALSFAPLALTGITLLIREPEVVRKSYPEFWDHLRAVGFILVDDDLS